MSRKVNRGIERVYGIYKRLLSMTAVCLGCVKKAEVEAFVVKAPDTSAPSSFIIKFICGFPIPATLARSVIYAEFFRVKKEAVVKAEAEGTLKRPSLPHTGRRYEFFHKTGLTVKAATVNLARDCLETEAYASWSPRGDWRRSGFLTRPHSGVT